MNKPEENVREYEWLCRNMGIDVVELTYRQSTVYFVLQSGSDVIDANFILSADKRISTAPSVPALLERLPGWSLPDTDKDKILYWLEEVKLLTQSPTLICNLDKILTGINTHHIHRELIAQVRDFIWLARYYAFQANHSALQKQLDSKGLEKLLNVVDEKRSWSNPHPKVTFEMRLDENTWQATRMSRVLEELAAMFWLCLST